MKRVAYLALGATLLMTLGASLQPAQAICNNPRLITSGYSYVYTPGYESGGGFMNSSVSENLIGQFWGLDGGDLATPGAGNDNGTFPALGGWVGLSSGYPAYINSTWGASTAIDGCIDSAPEPRCMAILLMDNDGDTGTGAFALLTAAPDAETNYRFEQEGGGPINLVTVPSLSITASVRTGSCSVTTTQACALGTDCPAGETCEAGTGVDVSVDGIELSAIEAGLYLDPNCPAPDGAGPGAGVIEGYQILSREVPRGAPPPTDTDVNAWTEVGDPTPLGDGASASLSCSGDTDLYLTTALVFDSGGRSAFVSGNSTRFECGANLADPEDVIQRKPRNRERPRSRKHGR